MVPEFNRHELAVMNGLAAGKSYKQIANDLGMKQFTVQWHARTVMERYDIHTAAGLVALALRQGWIE